MIRRDVNGKGLAVIRCDLQGISHAGGGEGIVTGREGESDFHFLVKVKGSNHLVVKGNRERTGRRRRRALDEHKEDDVIMGIPAIH